MSSIYKRYFEIVPNNNIDNFTPDDGVDIINFIIPPVQGAILPTTDLVMTGNLQVFTNHTVGAEARYLTGDTSRVSIDNIAGIHGCISRVDITSRQGNVLMEQRQNYSLVSKWKRGVMSNEDFRVGRYNVQQLSSSTAMGSRGFLMSATTARDGTPFTVQLNTGILMDNVQQINLPASGGIELKIHLESTNQFLMNLDNSMVAGSKLTTDWSYRLTNVKLFGRYNYVQPALLNSLSGISFKAITNNMNTIQSSRDTMSFSPQVNSLDKILYIYQPNEDTRNNSTTNGLSTNQLIGLNNYAVSNNGVKFPYDYDITINPSLQNNATAVVGEGLSLNTVADDAYRQVGDAEVLYHWIVGMNGSYPPVHSMVNGRNYENSLADIYGSYATVAAQPNPRTNLWGNNIQGVGTSYQYGFEGYSTPMPNNLVQLETTSQVKTSDAVVPAVIRNQVQTENAFIVYNAQLSYAGMNVAK